MTRAQSSLGPGVGFHPAVVLGVATLGYFFVLLDVTIVNVALERIPIGLGASRGELQWVVDAYALALALASLMLSAGHIADGFGRRRVFTVGVAIFGLASAGCALAPTAGALIATRAPGDRLRPCSPRRWR